MNLERRTVSDAGRLSTLVRDFITQEQPQLIKLKRGTLSRKEFLEYALLHIRRRAYAAPEEERELLEAFEQYVFGYSILSPLIDDPEISDIRVIGYDRVRVKRKGERADAGISFETEQEYRQFIEYIATRNQANISNLNAISRFTDTMSHPGYILRFTLVMPIIGTYSEPYLCIRKVPRNFPQISDLVSQGMLREETAQLLAMRFRQGSVLICGGNSSGKTTLLNALKEMIPDNRAVLVVQQAEELTTMYHPDMMFLHSLNGGAESKVSYDLKEISIAGLTMDVDYFIIGEVKGAEALYLLNAACTGQICAATIHSSCATRAVDKLVDYAMYESRYERKELMRMMDCFETVVFMREFRVEEIYFCKGWDEERKELIYDQIL